VGEGIKPPRSLGYQLSSLIRGGGGHTSWLGWGKKRKKKASPQPLTKRQGVLAERGKWSDKCLNLKREKKEASFSAFLKLLQIFWQLGCYFFFSTVFMGDGGKKKKKRKGDPLPQVVNGPRTPPVRNYTIPFWGAGGKKGPKVQKRDNDNTFLFWIPPLRGGGERKKGGGGGCYVT